MSASRFNDGALPVAEDGRTYSIWWCLEHGHTAEGVGATTTHPPDECWIGAGYSPCRLVLASCTVPERLVRDAEMWPPDDPLTIGRDALRTIADDIDRGQFDSGRIYRTALEAIAQLTEYGMPNFQLVEFWESKAPEACWTYALPGSQPTREVV